MESTTGGDGSRTSSAMPGMATGREPTTEPLGAVCRECGARVPLVRDRWLHVHRTGSAEYAFPGAADRCPGSLMSADGSGAG